MDAGPDCPAAQRCRGRRDDRIWLTKLQLTQPFEASQKGIIQRLRAIGAGSSAGWRETSSARRDAEESTDARRDCHRQRAAEGHTQRGAAERGAAKMPAKRPKGAETHER